MLYFILLLSLTVTSPTQDNCKGEMKEGKRIDSWKCYYENGKLQTEGNYTADLKEGYWKLYHTNGKLAGEGNYEKDHEKGKWKFYDEEDKLMMEQDY